MKIDPGNKPGILDFLRKMSLFQNLGEESLRTFASCGKLVSYKKGDIIFLQGDRSEKFYIMQSGFVSILLGSSDGREMIINEMRTEDCFGELGVLTLQHRSTSATARTDCEVFIFPRAAFLSILEAEPILARRILDITAHRLRNSSERESALAFLDAQSRLARILLQLYELETEREYVTISQDELAQRTGLTRQTVAKTLGYWRRSGWLITGRGHIFILRHNELAGLAREWTM